MLEVRRSPAWTHGGSAWTTAATAALLLGIHCPELLSKRNISVFLGVSDSWVLLAQHNLIIYCKLPVQGCPCEKIRNFYTPLSISGFLLHNPDKTWSLSSWTAFLVASAICWGLCGRGDLWCWDSKIWSVCILFLLILTSSWAQKLLWFEDSKVHFSWT